MKLVGTGPTAAAIAVALGLDPKRTVSIRFDLAAGELAVVTVSRWVTDAEGKALGEVMERFNLIPEDEARDLTTLGDNHVRKAIAAHL